MAHFFTCQNCGKEFRGKPYKAPVYCGLACKKDAARKRQSRVCQNCGKEFRVNTSAKEGKYCSEACSAAGQRLRVVYTCASCGKDFEDRPSANRLVCSSECRNALMLGHQYNKGRHSPLSRKPDKSTLINLYVVQALSPKEIGERLEVQGQTVCKWLKEEGIEVRPSQTTFKKGMKAQNKITMPDAQELRKLYVEDDLSVRELAQIYSVSGNTISKWLRFCEIPIKDNPLTLSRRGITPPTAKELDCMIHEERLSYSQVAAKYGVDQSLVPIWLDKYGIARHKTWHELHNNPKDVERIKSLYEDGLSLTEIGSMYSVSSEPIKILLKANAIPVRKDGWQGKRFKTQRGELVRSTYELKVANWLHEQGVDYVYEPSLPFPDVGSADFLANGWYIEVWGVINSASYQARKELKRAGYARIGAPLIEIPAHSFDVSRKELWIRKLQHVIHPK